MAAVRTLCEAYRAELLAHDPAAPPVVAALYPLPVWTALRDALPQGHALVLLARLDGWPAGCGMAQTLPDGSLELKRLYPRPEARGHGIAAAMVDRLAEHARATGAPLLRLDTFTTLTAARRLYERLGFTACGPYAPLPAISEGRLCFYQRAP